MKKILLGLAFVAVSSFAMMAQNNNGNNVCQQKSNCSAVCVNANDCNDCANPENCANQQNCRFAKCNGKKAECKAFNRFDGLGLTDAQKSKLEEICKARCESLKNAKESYKKDKQLSAEQKKQLKADFRAKRLDEKKKFLFDVKSVLTPEQYTTFLENNFIQGGKDFGKNIGKNKGKLRGGHHGKKGHGHFAAHKGKAGKNSDKAGSK